MVVSNRVKAVTNIEGLIKVKERSYCKAGFSCIWNSYKIKSVLIGELPKVVSSYNNQLLFRGFAKLLSFRKPEEKVDTTPTKTNQKSTVKPRQTPVEPSSPELQFQPSQAQAEKSEKLKSMNTSLAENISKMEVRMESCKKEKRETTE